MSSGSDRMAGPHQRKVPGTSRSSSDPLRVRRRRGRVADLLSFDNETKKRGREGERQEPDSMRE